MVNRALKKVKENAAAAGISEDDAHEILGLQSSYDVIDSGVRGTGAGGTYEGGERVSVDERPEGVADVRGEKAAEVTTEEAPAAEEGEAPAAEEGEAAPVAARGEDVVEAAEVEGAAVGWTDKLRKNAEDAMEEWTEGRADDDPTWDQLADIHQLQWVKGYVDSYAQSRAAKPKEQGAVFYRELGERRKAVMRGVKEHVQDALNKVMPETTPREGQVVDAYAKLIAGVHDRAVAKRIMIDAAASVAVAWAR